MVTRPMRNIAHVNYLFRLIFNKVRINNGAFLKKYSKLIVAGKSTIIRRRYRERMQKKNIAIFDFAVREGWRHLSGEVGTRGTSSAFHQQCSRDRAIRNP